MIDPGIEALGLDRDFVKAEMTKFGITSVELNHFLYVKDGTPGAYLPRSRKILLDPSSMPAALQILKWNHALGLCLTEKEAWYFIFAHEAAHGDETKTEWQCDCYAKKVLYELRCRGGGRGP